MIYSALLNIIVAIVLDISATRPGVRRIVQAGSLDTHFAIDRNYMKNKKR